MKNVNCLLLKLPFRIPTSPRGSSVDAVELDEIFFVVCNIEVGRCNVVFG